MLLQKLLKEMPQITQKDGIVYADAEKLKDLKVEDVEDNIVIIRQPSPSMMIPQGATWVYFMDSSSSAQAMKNGKIDYIILLSGRAMGSYGEEPEFEKVFKKKAEGREHILGFMQGYSDDNLIRIDFMRVRKTHRRQSMNKKMLEALREHFPNAEVKFDDLTPDGRKFAQKIHPESLNEITDHQRQNLEDVGFTIIEEVPLDEYDLVLMHHPNIYGNDLNYTVGFQRKGRNFIDPFEQVSKEHIDSINFKDLIQIPRIIKRWIRQYDTLVIGSHNPEKNELYKTVFQRYDINIKRKNIHGINALILS